MEKIIKDILIKLENKGFEAYLVGGYVRDYLLKIGTYDVDICTSALPDDLEEIFGSKPNSFGGIHLKEGQYNITITSFR